MSIKEIADRVTRNMMEIVMVRYCDNPEKGIKVAEALSQLTTVISDEYDLDAICLLADIIRETEQEAKKTK